MNLQFLPDLVALAMLVSILMLVRRKYSDERTNAWLIGLFITLVESAAHTFYAPESMPLPFLHVTVLDCYTAAGLIFVWASSDPSLARRTRTLHLALVGFPLLMLATTYGLNLRVPKYYLPTLIAGFVVSPLSALVLKRPRRVAILQFAGWTAATFLIHAGLYRDAVYWAVACLYTTAAWNFSRRLERGNTGRIAIVAGFSAWALFFALHPWIVSHRDLSEIAAHFWNLQKSLISIGMILVMLEQKASADAYLAHHDELTGLPNRRMFAARLSNAVEHADRHRSSLALIVLDLDGFKAINDSQGHLAGDYVLREVAAKLRNNVRASDTVARMGGDEFIVLADGLTSELSAWRLAESIQAAIDGPIHFQGTRLDVSVSVGLAMYPDDAVDPIKLLRIADQRMYGLKKQPAAIRQLQVHRPGISAS